DALVVEAEQVALLAADGDGRRQFTENAALVDSFDDLKCNGRHRLFLPTVALSWRPSSNPSYRTIRTRPRSNGRATREAPYRLIAQGSVSGKRGVRGAGRRANCWSHFLAPQRESQFFADGPA